VAALFGSGRSGLMTDRFGAPALALPYRFLLRSTAVGLWDGQHSIHAISRSPSFAGFKQFFKCFAAFRFGRGPRLWLPPPYYYDFFAFSGYRPCYRPRSRPRRCRVGNRPIASGAAGVLAKHTDLQLEENCPLTLGVGTRGQSAA
jgi:hypothetical protein